MFSRFFAFFILIILFPILTIIVLAIFIEDGCPILFTQKRVGINYTFFKIYKFRSMKNNSPDLATHLLTNPEKYLLKTGRLLRKLSLDELPNFLNIVKGEMNFVGPRPALHSQKDLMVLRLASGVDKLKPGITGWAQINGRDDISMKKKVQLEQQYFNKKSFLFDLEIIIKTFMINFKL
mgnify:CR=1 FL=1|jgi:O-antigen biosynthesis protein WbqP|tara:strand:- start:355 stop:891 length:537 start_codon:yes stop_codon:yes gene_type:complete